MTTRDWRAGTIRCALAGASLLAGACAGGESRDRQAAGSLGDVASSAQALSAWDSIPLAGRSEHGAVALDHDRVLVCGGLSEAWTDLSDCRILNAESGSSTAGPALPLPRRFLTLTRLSQTAPWPVLLVGGGQSPNLVANALVGTEAGWVSESALRRRYHTATRLSDGSVLVVGGDNHAAAFVSEVQRRTPNGTWMDAGQQERLLHAAVVVNTEEGEGVLAVGGFDLAENALGSMDLYDVDANRWSTAGTLPEPRGWATATALDDGWVLIVGGVGSLRSIRPYASALLYNVNTGEWSSADQGVSLVPRMKHQAARLGRYVVVAGGLTEGPNQNTISLSSVQVFDIETKTWADLLPMTNGRSLFELTALEGRLVASGGEGAIGSAEVLEPLSLGSSCESGAECVSGHCEGAVCCETACSGACRTCNGETPGECVVVEEGTPPETLACDGYTCSAGDCQDRCERDADCIASHFCQNGACVERQDLGDPCERAEQCGDGLSCTDGVCCETECSGQCEFCDGRGRCMAAPPGPPVGEREPCEGGDPGCAASCDGYERRQCIFPGDTKVCGAASCDAGIETRRGTCSGDGSCEQDTIECGAYACGLTVCLRTCETDDQCAANHYCERGDCRLQCTPETAESDCGIGQICMDGRCSQPRCTPDRRGEVGGIADCGAYVCSYQTGKCLDECTSNWDCAPGNYCARSGECLPSPLFDGRLEGCSVSVRRGRSAPNPTLGALLAALVAFELRRRSGRRREVEMSEARGRR